MKTNKAIQFIEEEMCYKSNLMRDDTLLLMFLNWKEKIKK